MKIILSRKGFDSANGGMPNLILPDDSFLVFPIPDDYSEIKYSDVKFEFKHYKNLSQVLSDLGNTKIKNHYAHLDPDMTKGSLPRKHGWKPLFGQRDSALSHLLKQKVTNGDLFLFFATFQKTDYIADKLIFDKTDKPRHIIYGYFSVGDYIDLSIKEEKTKTNYDWAKYHPHFKKNSNKNGIFVSSDYLQINEKKLSGPGASIFKKYRTELLLTCSDEKKSIWKLPTFFWPDERGKPTMTYHKNENRWERFEDHLRLKSVGRGQEFVFDIGDNNKEVEDWLRKPLEF